MQRLSQTGSFDYILIESTGVGEPLPVAQTFTYADEEQGVDLSRYCRLDCMVTVVDAYRFWHDFSSGEKLLDRSEAVGENDEREVVDLLIDQIEFCDVLLLNKCDRVAPVQLDKLEAMLRKLQPRAKLIRTVRGKVDPKEILHTGLFDFEEASLSAGWIRELQQPEHTPETEEYGISSFIYARRRPFHPERLMEWMKDWPEEVVRAKGTVWLATRNDVAQQLSQAGPSIQFGPAGWWAAALPEEERSRMLEDDEELRGRWHPKYGDRINELVLIGIGLEREALAEGLDRCLLTDGELLADWSALADDFPAAAHLEID